MPADPVNRRTFAPFDAWSTGSTWLALAVAALLLISVDHAFPAVGMGPAYIPLIALAAWRLGLGAACTIALTAAFLNIFPHHADEAVPPVVAAARGMLRLGTYAFVVAAVSALRRVYDRERNAAQRDFLTGAFNRGAFHERSATSLARGTRSGGALALVLIDVDGFKGINDAHGHAAGDDILRLLVRTAAPFLGRDDCLGRLGGDEFAVILCAATVGEVLSRTESFHRTVSDGLACLDVPATASMGACILFAGASVDASRPMQEADRLMYEAKAAGPGGLRSGTFSRGQIRPASAPSRARHDDEDATRLGLPDPLGRPSPCRIGCQSPIRGG